ncbi:hypothetical protein AB4305_34480 [Nocardia sp. 2YAB30]
MVSSSHPPNYPATGAEDHANVDDRLAFAALAVDALVAVGENLFDIP